MSHPSNRRLWIVAVLIASVTAASFGGAHQGPDPADRKVLSEYRAWLAKQPRDVQRAPDVLDRYAAQLKKAGVTDDEAARRIQVIRDSQQRSVDVWNKALTDPKPTFNTNPTAFLVEVVKDLPPGRALDVGMGQGRNAIYLAQQGWDVTGFDRADQAVAAAQASAKKLGVKLTTHVSSLEAFDFGKDRWDLVLITYSPVRTVVDAIVESLRPGGYVLIETFHRDIFRGDAGRGDEDHVFDTNELPTLFNRLRIRRYEDRETAADYGPRRERTAIVRLLAQKR